MATYTVKKGDTLSQIAANNGTTVSALLKLNPGITNANLIYVGQQIVISGSAATPPATNNGKAVVDRYGLVADSNREMYAGWTWSKDSTTDHYLVRWSYSWGVGIEAISESTTKFRYSTFTPPDYATHVTVIVKPIAKTTTKNNVETALWTADWSTRKTYWYTSNLPEVPPSPSVTVKDCVLTAELTGLNLENATHIKFQVMVEGSTKAYKTSGEIPIVQGRASYSCTVAAGNKYVVQCKSIGPSGESAWSGEDGDWSNSEGTEPMAPTRITTCRAVSETSVYLVWSPSDAADRYEIEYATDKSYFDESNATRIEPTTKTNYTLTGLESGKEYFFRVRAGNDKGYSGWTAIASVVIGKPPEAPTTWSSTTTAIVGEKLRLYWLHNSADGSAEKSAEIELTIDGVTENIWQLSYNIREDQVSSYELSTSDYSEGAVILWRVRTKGIVDEYGEWSVQRRINVYARPTLSIALTGSEGKDIEQLESFPIRVTGTAGPNTQTPIGYHLTVRANSAYETTDHIGNVKMVSKGESVFSRYYDTNDQLTVALSASDMDLENNIEYTVECVVSMNSGLTAEASATFLVAWTDNAYAPNAEVGIDTETYSAMIRPYCEDEYGVPIEYVLLSVYRREYDGSFTEIIRDIENEKGAFVTDPHPALDYARYRIVAMDRRTGAISFYDMPGIPVGGKAVVLQWNEAWSNFRVGDEPEEVTETPWSGSMLKLPFNIDVSNNHQPDVELIEYIGRSNPVSYYGTQHGETATWNTVIDAKDTETLYQLRRLSKWMGDVYVREPSGSGYWANVIVSFSQKHREVTIPVQLEIVRVEGGV